MEEDASSIVSKTKLNLAAETSDSFSNYALHASKRARHDTNANVAKFKGVVPQQNGHWGAQIYANHQRIWLGTFKSDKEAAMAYDSSSIKLRSRDSHRNFPWTDHNIQELSFQNHYSTDAVLNMIRDGSYQPKFANFLSTQSQRKEIDLSLNQTMVHDNVQFSCRQLFQKELTPSDVGKLNRLVIPKKFAVKYFPSMCENVDGGGLDDIELVFYDKLMRSWKFRYCYWKSSQSFVFTRGWNRFVKEKNLKEKDVVTFCTCGCPDEAKEGQNFFLIDVNYSGGQSCMVEGINNYEVQLEQNLGQNFSHKIGRDDKEFKEEKVFTGLESTHNVEGKRFRLFGVHID